MEWQMAIGIMFIVMTLAVGVILGWYLCREIMCKKPTPLFLWLCLSVIVLGIVSILSILIVNIY